MPKYGIRERGKDDSCCGVFFLKYVIFIFNFIFWVSGGALLGIGIWTLIMKMHYVSLLASATYIAATYILIAAGAAIIIIGIIGCCGAWHENRCALMTYASLLLVVFLLEAVAGVLAYVYQANVHEELSTSLNKTMTHHYNFDQDKTKAINDMQQEFRCCGAANYKDWAGSRWYKEEQTDEARIPESCCISPGTDCTIRDNKLRTHPSNIYDEGCIDSLANFIRQHLIIIGAVGIGLCIIQIFGIIFACCLAKAIKDWELRQQNYNW